MDKCGITTCHYHEDGISGESIYIEFPIKTDGQVATDSAVFCSWLCLLKFANNQEALKTYEEVY